MKKPKYYSDIVQEIGKGWLLIRDVKKIILPEGKTTPKGNFLKFKDDEQCAYPERADCNIGDFYTRCEHMKFLKMGHWICTYGEK